PEKVKDIYAPAGYPVFAASAKERSGLEELSGFLAGKNCVLAGPSGVGKSSLINAIYPDENRSTGELSAKIGRGRHTTRETSLIEIFPGAFVMDTPGFTSLDITGINPEELPGLFPEFRPFLGKCRFSDCAHAKEEDCAVKEAVGGAIAAERYKRYGSFLEELKDN
ncbi:MAG: ribosome small subunit-dependent GTPase A, partial [Defluviitaleaceae bacterium]|nr:ribosome small subunit-dependent GTPase A [Defluviitaleaceae bacterium]